MTPRLLAKGTRCRVTFDIVLPADASDDEVDQWLRFELGERAQMKTANLCNFDIQACWRSVDWSVR